MTDGPNTLAQQGMHIMASFFRKLFMSASWSLLLSCTPPNADVPSQPATPHQSAQGQQHPIPSPTTSATSSSTEAPELLAGEVSCAEQPNIECFERWLNETAGALDSKRDGTAATSAPDSSSSEDTTRIVGGKDYSGYPAIGAVKTRKHGTTLFKNHCSGTLIGKLTVLTAAHCVVGFETHELEFVIAPDANIAEPNQRFKVAHRLHHRDYVNKRTGFVLNVKNDIALLYLDSAMVPKDEVVRLSIADSTRAESVLSAKAKLAHVGYGLTKDSAGYKVGAGIKRLAAIPVTSHDSKTFRYRITPEKGMTCNGDSGGPALAFHGAGETSNTDKLLELAVGAYAISTIILGPNNTIAKASSVASDAAMLAKLKDHISNPPVIVGITSWGDGPCSSFGVDVRVDAYSSWIKLHTDQAMDGPG